MYVVKILVSNSSLVVSSKKQLHSPVYALQQARQHKQVLKKLVAQLTLLGKNILYEEFLETISAFW